MRAKGINATDNAKMLGVSRATVYRYLAEDKPLTARLRFPPPAPAQDQRRSRPMSAPQIGC